MTRARLKSASPNGSATESLAERSAEFLEKLVSDYIQPFLDRGLRRAEPHLTAPLVAAGLLVASAVFLMQAGREALLGSGAPPWLSSLTMALVGLASALALLYRQSQKE